MTVVTASSPPATAEPGRPVDRRRFAQAAILGSAVSLAVFLGMLLGPHLSLVSGRGLLSSFLDAQARSILHGRLSVPSAQASIEGFSIHGRSYLYFGIAPSLLRIPVLLFTHSLDGRLTQLSMLFAFLVLMVGTGTLHWQVRGLVRPHAEVARRDLWAAAVIQVAVGAGSVVLFLSGWPVVYHELELWGVALAIAGLSAAVATISQPTTRRIAWAGFLSLLAMHSRPSVGLAPVLALLVLAVGLTARISAGAFQRRSWTRLARIAEALAEFGPRNASRDRRALAWLLGGVFIALASTTALQYAKFRTFGLPVTHQVGVNLDPVARASVAANHGSLFGLQYVPTTLLAAIRPDAVGTMRAFPFIGFPHALPTQIGSSLFESVQPSLSATTSMTLLCLLTLAGLPAVIRRRGLRPLAGMLVGAAVAFVPVLTVSDVATRYVSDSVPLLVLGALIGLHTLLCYDARSTSRALALGLPVAASVLTAWGIAVNGGAGLVLQRLVAPDTPEADRAAFVGTQDDIDRFLGRRPRGVRLGAALPARATSPLGDLFIVGRCAGLYTVGFGGSWLPVERTAGSGLHELVMRMLPTESQVTQALLTVGRGPQRVTLTVSGSTRAARFGLRVGGRAETISSPVRIASRTLVTLTIDPFAGRFSATLTANGHRLFAAYVPDEQLPETRGADPDDPSLRRFSGQVAAVVLDAPLCHRIARRAHLSAD